MGCCRSLSQRCDCNVPLQGSSICVAGYRLRRAHFLLKLMSSVRVLKCCGGRCLYSRKDHCALETMERPWIPWRVLKCCGGRCLYSRKDRCALETMERPW